MIHERPFYHRLILKEGNRLKDELSCPAIQICYIEIEVVSLPSEFSVTHYSSLADVEKKGNYLMTLNSHYHL